MLAKNNANKGVTFFVVIAILFVLVILVTSYNSMLRTERLHMYRIIYGDNALIIAEAAMDLLQRVVEDEFAKTGYERKNTYFNYEDLIKPKGEFATVNFNSDKLTDLIANSEPIKCLIDVFGGSVVARIKKVEVYIDEKNVKYFAEVCGMTPNFTANTREKFGLINYAVQVEYYQINKALNITKQIKIVHTLPKALRHFTLFVKNIPKDTDLNKLLVDDNGNPVSGKPLVLNNGEYNSSATASPLDCGVVFLGNNPASEPLVLKLSHGSAKTGVGELFHLLDKFYLDQEFKKKYGGNGFQVGHYEYGVSSGMAGAKIFGIRSSKDILSSMLKLYGTPGEPTPTRVLGNVNRCYLRLAAYQDTPTNGNDFMGDMPNAPPEEFQTTGVKPIAEKGEDPIQTHSCEWIAKKILPETLGGSDLYQAYAEFMNQFIDYEPYNYSMCTPIKDKNSMACDPNKIPEFAAKLYPSGTNSFGGRPVKPVDEEYTGDDLRKLVLDEKYALPYASYKFNGDSDFADFKKMFMNGSNPDALRLGLAALFENGVKLPKMYIEKGGMIICKKGDITISGDIEADPAQNQVLTIIAMDGDITVSASKVEAVLIAMKDGLKYKPSKTIDMSGTLAVNSLDFDSLLSGGGKISFRPTQTLSSSQPHFYYASIQPDVRHWKVVIKNE